MMALLFLLFMAGMLLAFLGAIVWIGITEILDDLEVRRDRKRRKISNSTPLKRRRNDQAD